MFLLVLLPTFSVARPFIFMHNAPTAMRVSNAIAIGLLFMTGFAQGRCVGRLYRLLVLHLEDENHALDSCSARSTRAVCPFCEWPDFLDRGFTEAEHLRATDHYN